MKVTIIDVNMKYFLDKIDYWHCRTGVAKSDPSHPTSSLYRLAMINLTQCGRG